MQQQNGIILIRKDESMFDGVLRMVCEKPNDVEGVLDKTELIKMIEGPVLTQKELEDTYIALQQLRPDYHDFVAYISESTLKDYSNGQVFSRVLVSDKVK